MNREIKFRAWDKESNTMLDWEYILHFFSINYFEDEDFEWMQYTGLKDKSGTEIYEGDVVTVHVNEHDITGNKNQIVWKGCGFWFMDISGDEDTLENLYVYDQSAYILNVIGNIFENVELLKGEKL